MASRPAVPFNCRVLGNCGFGAVETRIEAICPFGRGERGGGTEGGHAKKEDAPLLGISRARCAVTGAHHITRERREKERAREEMYPLRIYVCILSQCACRGVMRARPRVDRREALRVNWIRVTRREKLRRNDGDRLETAVKQRVSKLMQPDMRRHCCGDSYSR